MNKRRHVTRAIALFAMLSILAVACGSTVVEVADVAAEPVPAASDSETAAAGGHQYGSSIDDWTAEAQAAEGASSNDNDGADDLSQSAYEQIEWADLIPSGSSAEELLAEYEDRLDAAEPRSEEAEEIFAELRAAYNPEAVNTELEGKQIRLAGFVAALSYDDDIVTEFLLVPTFGACVHVPAPPPNQTVLVSVDKENGLTLDESWGAVWVAGTLAIDSATTDLASASYKITDAISGVYNDF